MIVRVNREERLRWGKTINWNCYLLEDKQKLKCERVWQVIFIYIFYDHTKLVLSIFVDILKRFATEFAPMSFSRNNLCLQSKLGEFGWISSRLEPIKWSFKLESRTHLVTQSCFKSCLPLGLKSAPTWSC